MKKLDISIGSARINGPTNGVRVGISISKLVKLELIRGQSAAYRTLLFRKQNEGSLIKKNKSNKIKVCISKLICVIKN